LVRVSAWSSITGRMDYLEFLKAVPGQKHVKGFLWKPSTKRNRKLVKLIKKHWGIWLKYLHYVTTWKDVCSNWELVRSPTC
jgi:hypothetical protein